LLNKEIIMAIFDAMFELSDDQDISQAAGTVASTDIIDWTQADLEMGAGEPLWLNVRMGTEALDSAGGAATLVVALCHDTVAPIDSSSTVIYQTAALTETICTAGAWLLRMPLPYNVDDGRINGLLYTIAGETSTTGTIDAWVDHGPQSSYDTQVSASNI
jgi:hypothetical protein